MTGSTSDSIDAELAKRWWSQRSAMLQARYDESQEADRRRDSRFTMWAAVITYIGFAGMDFIVLPDVAMATAMTRLGGGVAAFVVMEAMFRRGASARSMDMMANFIIVGCYVGWLVAAQASASQAALSLYMIFGTIFMMVSNLIFNFRFTLSAISSGVILAVGVGATVDAQGVDNAYVPVFATFYFACFVATLFVNFKLNRERYNVFLNELQARLRQEKVTERGEALLRLSHTDSLTGLKNRRAVDEELRTLWEGWHRQERNFAALLIDIDFFKPFNDHYGHQEGDRCLTQVAKALSDFVETRGGTVGRYGGEEFIALAAIKADEEMGALAESLRRAVEGLQFAHEHRADSERVVTVSIGVASAKHLGAERVERLVSAADRALYRAKANGRNRIWVFDPSADGVRDEGEEVALALPTAIEDGLVSLVYQPIFEPGAGRIAAAETLMRLVMPDGKPVSPLKFIPIAERTGAILELGRWAIRTACHEILARDLVPLVSVNVSSLQMRAPGFALSVAAIVADAGVSARRLAFEITEGREIETHPDVLRCIAELKQLGVQIWLDDFGTGFAGLSCLRAIDFDVVKIDRSFLHESATERGAAMLRDILQLVSHRGPQVVVEGVETERQLKFLADCGVELAQGFHFGRPSPAASFHLHLVDEAETVSRRA